ncbi:hypothetical protein PV08_02950 [Exophiala spinifera]|uniref:Uncharacterized protein n=1 Tax=Exophiala spinifera TaxID=91928 RepID=A0A0D1YTS8_9EURO|nr:uncharacterized protein PV08_02950 [Exophiala spinifera]KIW18661.1 hypothetical protein PV08_02950 [Exophiala spinifera]
MPGRATFMSPPSVLEYARFHGLALDYRSSDPFAYLNTLEPNGQIVEVDPALSDPVFLFLKPISQESKLQLSREASQILSDSIKDPCSDISSQHLVPRFRRLKNLKLEEPLLSTDHQTDVWNFKRSTPVGVQLRSILLRAEPFQLPGSGQLVDEFNHVFRGRTHGKFEQVGQERLLISRGTLSRISKVCLDDWNEMDKYDDLMVRLDLKKVSGAILADVEITGNRA